MSYRLPRLNLFEFQTLECSLANFYQTLNRIEFLARGCNRAVRKLRSGTVSSRLHPKVRMKFRKKGAFLIENSGKFFTLLKSLLRTQKLPTLGTLNLRAGPDQFPNARRPLIDRVDRPSSSPYKCWRTNKLPKIFRFTFMALHL